MLPSSAPVLVIPTVVGFLAIVAKFPLAPARLYFVDSLVDSWVVVAGSLAVVDSHTEVVELDSIRHCVVVGTPAHAPLVLPAGPHQGLQWRRPLQFRRIDVQSRLQLSLLMLRPVARFALLDFEDSMIGRRLVALLLSFRPTVLIWCASSFYFAQVPEPCAGHLSLPWFV